VIGGWRRSGGYSPIGTRPPIDAGTLAAQILETGRPARLDSYLDASGSLVDVVRELGWRASVGAPLIVEGRLWGVLVVASTTDRPLPPATEPRLAEFAALVATADATRGRIERDRHDGAQPRLVSRHAGARSGGADEHGERVA
jgi:GAF domain-containing protein